MKKKISVLIPIYNEVENIKNIYESIKLLFLNRLKNYNYEILFLDNASNDGSRDECLKIKKSDENTLYLRQSRNFGYQWYQVGADRKKLTPCGPNHWVSGTGGFSISF